MDSRRIVVALIAPAFAALVIAGCNQQAKKEEPKPAAAEGQAEGEAAQSNPQDAFEAPPDVAAPPADAQKTPSGLATKVLKPGEGGKKPLTHDKVSVHYTGWTTDGKMFDSSIKRGRPATFGVTGVIPGWTEALQLMTKGEKRRLWIPENLAYKGRPGSPQGMLVFDVELLDIIEGVAPIPAPDDVAAAPEDATKTESGLAYKQLTPGTGDKHPNSWDEVEVNYTGWTTDGQMFDSSKKRGKPARFLLNKVIPGWTEGVQLMKEGEKARFWIPEDLAYSGRPGAPKGTLVFDIELLEINEKPEPPPAPKNVAAPPKNAKKTDSGLSYLRLEKGKGNKKPEATDRVEVHYTGWTTDGKMFDSSVVRGKTTTFPLNRVIPGWTEGLQLMTEGEKARLWIPEELAYKGRPGAPKGMLVFDVELVKILDAPAAAAASPHGNPAAADAAKKAAMQAAAKKAAEQAAAKQTTAAAKSAAEKPAEKPAAKPAEKAAAQPAAKPAEEAAAKPAEKSAEKTAEKPAAEKPAAEPAEAEAGE